jgi:hypothetical protein
MIKDKARDLDADLDLCEAATLGPWKACGGLVISDLYNEWLTVVSAPRSPLPERMNIKFIAAAREGWPYAIQLAQQLEREVEQLQKELQIYKDQDCYKRGPWD